MTTSVSLLDSAVGWVPPALLLAVTTTTAGGASWPNCWWKNSPLLSAVRVYWHGEGGVPTRAMPLRMHRLAALGALANTSVRVPVALRE
ncbi:hypothetical protein D3C75_987110 [compost metagenome]